MASEPDVVTLATQDDVPIHRHGELHLSAGRHPIDGTWRTRCGLTWDEQDMRPQATRATCTACLAPSNGGGRT